MVVARHGMAATSHPLATLGAIDILRQGGNAMDAAIAACAIHSAVEPGSTGIGGDCFALYCPGGHGTPIAYNGSGRTPAAASVEWYRERGFAEIPRQSPHAVTVPGAVEAWARLLADHGRLSLEQVLRPAVTYAREGYAVAPRMAFDWARQRDLLMADPASRRIFLPGDVPPGAGDVHVQTELADTLEGIGRHGPAHFYRGAVAEDMVRTLRAGGGLHTMEDFATAAGEYVTPVQSRYRGHDLFECPPNGQGIIAQIILNILEGLPVGEDVLSVERLHLLTEATRLGYGVRDAVVADPALSEVPVDWMLSEQLAGRLRASIDPARAMPAPPVQQPEHKDTVYITVVDKDRNAVSFINSIFHAFGSGMTAPRSGVLFHNRGQSFVVEPGHPNCIGPAKRPMHTIIPAMLMKDGRIELSFGVMGGHYQAMGHAYFLSAVLDHGLDIQSALDLPRLFPLPGRDVVEIERPFPAATRDGLRALGHTLVPASIPLGGGQAVRVDWATGTLWGASDHRKDGMAMGY